ncbi:MAG: serine dehydratase subunit alpha family protein [Chloroflexi bacterium]|nr:serine dehydratase subunit alpha family protein [Chloroflexota bacterium]
MELNNLIAAMQAEIELSIGCTEIGCAALAAARASELLDGNPDRVQVEVSSYLYKNAANVCVPNTRLRGMDAALALGFILKGSQDGLAILQRANPSAEEAARQYLRAHTFETHIVNDGMPVFLRLTAQRAGRTALVEIAGEHSHFSEIRLDGSPLLIDPPAAAEGNHFAFQGICPREMVEFIIAQDDQVFAFLLDQARINEAAAQTGLNDPGTSFGPRLHQHPRPTDAILNAACQAQAQTAAASEARMLGLPVPVAALTGSGNHGITALLGMYSAAQALGASQAQTARALAITVMITIYVKHSTSRLTTFCGCAVAPAAGIAAGCVYLMGGGFETMQQAMQSLIGTFAGMLCDGAKESCAWKVSTAASAAVQFAHLAMQGAYIPDGNGILGYNLLETFDNLGKLNNPGMLETNRVVMEIIHNNLNRKPV